MSNNNLNYSYTSSLTPLKSKNIYLVDTNKLRNNGIRKQYWNKFIDNNKDFLQYIYDNLFTETLKDNISLEDWIYFAFKYTSTNELKKYN